MRQLCLPAYPPTLQERADDEHTNRGMRLVQLEQEAMSRGYPLGDGIGLFGVGSAPQASSRGGVGRAESSMELNRSVHSSRGKMAGAGGSTVK